MSWPVGWVRPARRGQHAEIGCNAGGPSAMRPPIAIRETVGTCSESGVFDVGWLARILFVRTGVSGKGAVSMHHWCGRPRSSEFDPKGVTGVVAGPGMTYAG